LPQNSLPNLARVFRLLFAGVTRDVLSRITLEEAAEGKLPDLTHWIAPAAQAVKPVLLGMFQAGMARAAARLGQRRPSEGGREGFRRYQPAMKSRRVGKERGKNCDVSQAVTVPLCVAASLSPSLARRIAKAAPTLGAAWDLYNPKVLDAVDQAALVLCRETLDTAVQDAKEAVADLRRLLKEGLGQGAAQGWLVRKIGEVFGSPFRAWRIATTEGNRAVNLGQIYSSKEAGATTKTWLADANACEQCQELDEKTVAIDEPFLVDGTGPYARILCPPRHPLCGCTQVEEF